MMKTDEQLRAMASKHWDYIDALLDAHGVSEDIRQVISFHYVTAMIHGYGHGVEDSGK